MDIDMPKVLRRLREYYGDPVRVDEADRIQQAMSMQPIAHVTYDAMALLARISSRDGLNVDDQVEAIQWLIGRCEDQFVKAWLIQERELCKSAGGVRS